MKPRLKIAAYVEVFNTAQEKPVRSAFEYYSHAFTFARLMADEPTQTVRVLNPDGTVHGYVRKDGSFVRVAHRIADPSGPNYALPDQGDAR
jgi:hypothetical protein